jgi:hypothetical protein
MGIALSGTAHLVCSPDRPGGTGRFNPDWRTENVTTLAKGILVDYAFDRFPILADALEEAGCNDPILLKHCRECTKHQHSCWVLTCVSGRSRPPLNEQQVLDELDSIIPQNARRVPQPRTNEDYLGPDANAPAWERPILSVERALYTIALIVILGFLLRGYLFQNQTPHNTKTPMVKKHYAP